MLENLSNHKKVIGIKQTKRAIKDKTVENVFFAKDADQKLVAPICEMCQQAGLSVTWVSSMKELGQACEIEVGACMAATLKE